MLPLRWPRVYAIGAPAGIRQSMNDEQTRLIEALRSPEAWPHETAEIRVIETHISFVVLTGPFAYKIKKALKLPFLDFSTLARRERFCRDELSLNRRFARAIYLDVVPIGGDAAKPRVGATPALEFAVKMRQFPAERTADRLLDADGIDEAELLALAEDIAAFHQALEPAAGAEDPATAILANLVELEAALRGRDRRIERIGALLRQRVDSLSGLLAARRDGGAVRECHGDLHLGNVARIDDRLTPFDCLEFDRSLRTIDVIDEIAFLLMDLAARGRSDLAYAFANRYLEITGDYAGLEAIRLYSAHRALIRAKVAAIGRSEGLGGDAAQAGRYLDHALGALEPVPALLILMHGLSASGKTFVGDRLVAALPAIRIRSDVERKRLHGLGERARGDDDIGEGLYSQQATEATYRRLEDAAGSALAGGVSLIVDAAFLEREYRRRFRELALQRGGRCLILDCAASEGTLRRRIRQRAAENRDASDATEAVLDHQLATQETLDGEETAAALTIDTEGPIDFGKLAAAIRAR